MQRLNRRATLAGLGAMSLLSALPASAGTAARDFAIRLDGDEIGEQSVRVQRIGQVVQVDIAIDIRVRILGISAYRYEMTNRELWRDGAVQSIASRTNDNGTDHRVTAERESGGLRIAGTGFSGTIPGDVATTTYWTEEFLARRTWINTQDGTPLSVTASRLGAAELMLDSGPVACTKWRTGGDLALELYYDRNGEWLANRFEARGEKAVILAKSRDQQLTALW
ncbi:MAG: DUF6134 family protein [Pseudomonadota bacterium]